MSGRCRCDAAPTADANRDGPCRRTGAPSLPAPARPARGPAHARGARRRRRRKARPAPLTPPSRPSAHVPQDPSRVAHVQCGLRAGCHETAAQVAPGSPFSPSDMSRHGRETGPSWGIRRVLPGQRGQSRGAAVALARLRAPLESAAPSEQCGDAGELAAQGVPAHGTAVGAGGTPFALVAGPAQPASQSDRRRPARRAGTRGLRSTWHVPIGTFHVPRRPVSRGPRMSVSGPVRGPARTASNGHRACTEGRARAIRSRASSDAPTTAAGVPPRRCATSGTRST